MQPDHFLKMTRQYGSPSKAELAQTFAYRRPSVLAIAIGVDAIPRLVFCIGVDGVFVIVAIRTGFDARSGFCSAKAICILVGHADKANAPAVLGLQFCGPGVGVWIGVIAVVDLIPFVGVVVRLVSVGN